MGLTRYADKRHLARAVLEANAYQTKDIVRAMARDSGVELRRLKVDGGMVANDLLMQFQADVLGVPVIRPRVAETTCLGAAYAAGLAVGFWQGLGELRDNWAEDKTWQPAMDPQEVERGLCGLAKGGAAHPGLGGLDQGPKRAKARRRTFNVRRAGPGALSIEVYSSEKAWSSTWIMKSTSSELMHMGGLMRRTLP